MDMDRDEKAGEPLRRLGRLWSRRRRWILGAAAAAGAALAIHLGAEAHSRYKEAQITKACEESLARLEAAEASLRERTKPLVACMKEVAQNHYRSTAGRLVGLSKRERPCLRPLLDDEAMRKLERLTSEGRRMLRFMDTRCMLRTPWITKNGPPKNAITPRLRPNWKGRSPQRFRSQETTANEIMKVSHEMRRHRDSQD